MGNSPSSSAKPDKAGSQQQSPGSGLHRERERGDRQREREREREDRQRERERDQARERDGDRSRGGYNDVQRRRESLHSLSSVKASAAPPSTNLMAATAHHPSVSASATSQARAIPTPSSSSSSSQHTRSRPRITAVDSNPLSLSPRSTMGGDQSKMSAYHTLKSPTPPPEPRLSPASRPVDIAAASQPSFRPSPIDPSAPPSEAFHLPPSSFSRPPRLPLPIEEEVHNPGSPVANSPVEPPDLPEPEEIPRRSSTVSSTNDDDNEPDDFEAYSADAAGSGPKTPIVVEWKNTSPNDRVYVTGTFANWERKFRLHKDGPSKNKDSLSTTLQLPPGTHHIKFIVNGDMLTSDDLPTTVDYTNILVNYLEITLNHAGKSTPADPTASSVNQTSATARPPTGPAATLSPGQASSSSTTPTPSRPLDIRPRPLPADNAGREQPRGTPPPPASIPQHRALSKSPPRSEKPRPAPSPANLQRQPPKHYTSNIPSYLLDLDTWIPSSKEDELSPSTQAVRHRFEQASAAAESQPAPPSLPMFLSKSILNGTTPMKDDSSVLIMPNHTVLNHLATTNIKQGVLATSATTRYKRKFLTTIMYKPRSDDGD